MVDFFNKDPGLGNKHLDIVNEWLGEDVWGGYDGLVAVCCYRQ